MQMPKDFDHVWLHAGVPINDLRCEANSNYRTVMASVTQYAAELQRWAGTVAQCNHSPIDPTHAVSCPLMVLDSRPVDDRFPLAEVPGLKVR